MHDITVDNASRLQVVRVHIKASKTDPFRKGVHVFLGRTEYPLCPVTALLAYMVIRGRAPGPLFFMAHGAFLTFVQEVRKALSIAGIDQAKYAGHSFRIGAASTASAAGIED